MNVQMQAAVKKSTVRGECCLAVMRPLKLVNFLLIILSCSNNLLYSHYKHAVYWGQREEGDWNPAGHTHTHTHENSQGEYQ